MSMVLLITVLIGSFSIYEHRQEVIGLKTEQAAVVGNVVAQYANGDMLKELSDADSETAYYEEMRALLSDIKTATGVKYLYAVKPLSEEQMIRYIVEGQAPGDNPE